MKNDIVEIEIVKFNPYHDAKGRFTTGGGGHASFTYAPGKSKAHDNAIAREKERQKHEEALDKIGGKGASTVRAALKEGKIQLTRESQLQVARRINESKIRMFEEQTDRQGRKCHSFRLEGYDKEGSSVTSHAPKEWYGLDTAICAAAYSSIKRQSAR